MVGAVLRAYRGAGPISAEDVGSRGRVTVPGSDAVSNLLPEGRNPLHTETSSMSGPGSLDDPYFLSHRGPTKQKRSPLKVG
jgi:hypothetical protein